MPCFGNESSAEAKPRWEAFVHVVDYYFRQGGESIPYPEEVNEETLRAWGNPLERYLRPVHEPNWSKVNVIIRQILLHLDCDGVDVFYLKDVSNFIADKYRPKTMVPKDLGYLWILTQCSLP